MNIQTQKCVFYILYKYIHTHIYTAHLQLMTTYDLVCRYDLHEKNLAIIHCPSGHPSTGILIACLLKYIGAFNKSEDAYDFYCTKR